MVKKKVCLLGPFATGKTSLIERFVYSRFDEKYLATIGVKVSEKVLSLNQRPEGGQLFMMKLLIWDIAAMKKFDQTVFNYYRGASGALAVADLTREETVPGLEEICHTFRSVCPEAAIIVVGNKLDIFHRDRKTLSFLKKLASDFTTDYLLTSAKTGEQVNAAFLALAHGMRV
jgi:small GTP-binding protein